MEILFGMSGKALHPDHSDFFNALGQRIRALRKERGWSLRDMVVKHDYHVSQWQAYEKGQPVTVDTLLRLATVFGLTLMELMGDLVHFPRVQPVVKIGKSEAASVPATKAPAKVKSAKSAQKKTAGK